MRGGKEMKIKATPKEIADLVVALQSQQDSKSSFVPCDSNGCHYDRGPSVEDPLSKN